MKADGKGEMRENPQTARSHDLYTKYVLFPSFQWKSDGADKSHPIEDSGVALIKGGILLNKVNKFVRYVKAAEPHERPYLKESPEFIQLDEDIKSFMCVPLFLIHYSPHYQMSRSADH
jgi:hypothetical protein